MCSVCIPAKGLASSQAQWVAWRPTGVKLCAARVGGRPALIHLGICSQTDHRPPGTTTTKATQHLHGVYILYKRYSLRHQKTRVRPLGWYSCLNSPSKTRNMGEVSFFAQVRSCSTAYDLCNSLFLPVHAQTDVRWRWHLSRRSAGRCRCSTIGSFYVLSTF
jgi:hypothetical protein